MNSMQLVYAKISIPFLDELPDFLNKLKEYVGEYRIEPHQINDWVYNNSIIISFYTDKVSFKEGESRQVNLTAMQKDGDWNFIEISK